MLRVSWLRVAVVVGALRRCRGLRPAALGRRRGARAAPLGSIEVSYLDPEAAAARGVREWPFSSRPAGVSEETVAAGTTRYVLDGAGEVEWSDYAGGAAGDAPVAVGPGSLVEATAQTNLRWRSDRGLTVLTPGFESFGAYGAVVAALVACFGYALARAGGS